MTPDLFTGALGITLLALALWMLLALTVDGWAVRTAQILLARMEGRKAWRKAYLETKDGAPRKLRILEP